MRIVTLGGGTGQATVLRALRHVPGEVTAVVGVTDDGGHSGQLRRVLGLPQVGDTRQCLEALLDEASLWGQLLRFRFSEGELRGVSVGNLILAALSRLRGGLGAAVEAVCREVALPQRVLPVSDASTRVGAELADGRRLVGEWQIIQRQPRSPITRVFLQPRRRRARPCSKPLPLPIFW
ncbi:MAG: hypothetical protein KatS3mg131_3043 [Candidatus Tectimicrobiota bacterium]|nr:MAG: hypothetical protein KatS3mg131_3043 [Candidatus Tectomicrobia bacterium]